MEFVSPAKKESWGTFTLFKDSEGNQFVLGNGKVNSIATSLPRPIYFSGTTSGLSQVEVDGCGWSGRNSPTCDL